MHHCPPCEQRADRFCNAESIGPYWETMIARPSLNLILLACQEPPGAPLRSGSIVMTTSSPGLSVWLDHPSRVKRLGDCPSRFQTTALPSCPLTSRRM